MEVVDMKKYLYCIVGMVFLSALAFAADKVDSTTKADVIKTNIVKVAKMHARGKVIEISDKAIKIERTVKGNVETMEFTLDKPAANIVVSDSVRITYIERDDKLAVSRIAKVPLKKKENKPAEAKSTSGEK